MTDYTTTLHQLQRSVLELVRDDGIGAEAAAALLTGLQKLSGASPPVEREDVAIIGTACKLPDAANLQQFAHNLYAGTNSVKLLPDARSELLKQWSPELAETLGHSDYQAGYLDDIFRFDPAFFRISPNEAVHMDPLQRLMLGTAYQAAENAGYGGERLRGSRTGIFVGLDTSESAIYREMLDADNFLSLTGSLTGIVASRLAYFLHLRGPAVVVDCACSSSLAALHQACLALRNKDCEMALVGGVNLFVRPQTQAGPSEIESPHSTLRAFDRESGGTLWGEGAVAVCLKPLAKAVADGDPVYAVIKGSAINNDGASNGITAPSRSAQTEVLTEAWERAGIPPETLAYIEAHGTGTKLGDPVEIQGIAEAFAKYTANKQFCGIGSVKSNVGHTVAASGLTSLLKAVLIVQHKAIPPSLHFTAPNPLIAFEDSPVYLVNRLEPIAAADHPVRVGVSSFGFSGTNVHLVLEEYRTAPVAERQDAAAPFLFPLSAKTICSLRQMATDCARLIRSRPDIDPADVSYTLQTGRGHYAHRLAVVADHRESLLAALESFANGADDAAIPGLYYGSHKSASRQLNEQKSGGQRLTVPNASSLSAFLRSLGEAYVRGDEPQWEALHSASHRRVLHLPGYRFDETQHVPEYRPMKQEGESYAAGTEQPSMLDCRLLSETPEQDVYETWFSTDAHWVLREHRIVGIPTVPGVTYLEIARRIGERYYPEQPLELRDVVFMKPFSLADHEQGKVCTIVRKTGTDQLSFSIASREAEPSSALAPDTWTTHVEGIIVAIADSGRPQRLDIDLLKQRLKRLTQPSEADRSEQPQPQSTDLFRWGPRWDNLKDSYASEQEALLAFRLPEQYKQDLEGTWLHPALLDNAANWVSFHLVEGAHLPFLYERFRIYDPIPQTFYAYVQFDKHAAGSPTASKEIYTIHFALADEEGNVVAQADNYSIKRVHQIDSVLTSGRNAKTWRRFTKLGLKEAPASQVASQYRTAPLLLIHGGRDWPDLATLFRSAGHPVTEVDRALLDASMDEPTESIDDRVIEAIAKQNIGRIVYVAPDHEAAEAPNAASLCNGNGLMQLAALVRSLVQAGIAHAVDVTVILREAYPVLQGSDRFSPWNAGLLAMSQVINQEYDQLRCRCIELDGDTPVERLLEDVQIGAPWLSVHYKQGVRFVPELQAVDPCSLAERNDVIREHGVYIITGGTGGLGLETARYLASKARVRLALIQRTPFPDNQQWQALLDEGTDERTADKLRICQDIIQSGSQIRCYVADVAQEEALGSALAKVREDYGRINGVFHTAGIAGTGMLFRKDSRQMIKVIEPKLHGALLLDRLTASDELELMVLYSSTSAFLGGIGQADYAAANRMLGAFADYRSSQGKRTLCIHWTAWQTTGMAADYGVDEDNAMFKAIRARQALEAMDQALHRELDQVAIGEFHLGKEQAREVEQTMFLLSPELRSCLQSRSADAQAELPDRRVAREEAALSAAKPVELLDATAGELGTKEQTLAAIWGEVLGLVTIHAEDSFYELGGDSIQAIQIVKQVKLRYSCDLPVTEVFQYPTIRLLARRLEEILAQSKPPEPADVKDDLEQLLELVEDQQLSIDDGVAWFVQEGRKERL